MSRTLKTNVTVHTEDGTYAVVTRGTAEGDLTDEQRKVLKDNPVAWEGENTEDEEKYLDSLVRAASATAPAGDREEVEDDFTDLTVKELREYAEENNIDLGEATRKADILAVVRGAE